MIPFWLSLLISFLILAGSLLALLSSVGLCRFTNFIARLHASALLATLATLVIASGSILYFSIIQNRFVLHELLIVILMIITTPIISNFLMRVAIYDKRKNDKYSK